MADGLAGGELAPERVIGERIAGRFVVERLIGRGQLSTAFRAHDDRLHRRVTVKVFHPRHRDDVHVMESQLAAARAVARLSHEHIAMVIDRGEHEGMPVVVLEYVRGENLQERIDRFAPLAVAEVVGYCLQAARALAYAHGHGVVHGNVRPGNLLLTEDRDVKVVDFGGGSYVAQLVGDPYAAPELREVDPDSPAEPSDDVYALGALAFIALTDQAPRSGIDPTQLQALRPDVSPRLAGTIARALATDPQDRHLSMRELAAELAAVHDSMASAPVERFDVDQPTQAWDPRELREAAAADSDEATTEAPTGAATTRARTGRRKRRERTAPRSPREARARILAWSMVLAPLAALVIFGVMIAGEQSSDQVEGNSTASNAPTTRVPVANVVSFDPPPGGDGSEHEDETPNVTDADRETYWQTEGYATTDFNGTKEGVGLVLQLDGDHDVREVQVATDLPNWVADVRWAPEPADTLDGWRAVSDETPIRDNGRIAVNLEGERGGYLLLWVSRLALDVDDPNTARARVLELAVFATDESRG
jgi:hypothetical protein